MGNKDTLGFAKIPKHVAIILDGNGRWAKAHNKPRNYGHLKGSENVERICKEASKLGIEYVTVYAFSTENWKRPKEEVDALMKLLGDYLKKSIKESKKNNMRVRVIGDVSILPEKMQESIKKLEEASKDNTGLNFQVAINYGGRDEIIRAIRSLAKDINNDKISDRDINEKVFESYLDTFNIPEPDLLIRTSGEQRLSNFLLWQLAYAEFYFTDVYWPDFDKNELIKAIEFYNGRDRRFGAI
ncbi:MAG: isoprenyl transferase [Clostridiales bacterium]|nr:isoprenyl transferase [Clostridiales bacterium]